MSSRKMTISPLNLKVYWTKKVPCPEEEYGEKANQESVNHSHLGKWRSTVPFGQILNSLINTWKQTLLGTLESFRSFQLVMWRGLTYFCFVICFVFCPGTRCWNSFWSTMQQCPLQAAGAVPYHPSPPITASTGSGVKLLSITWNIHYSVNLSNTLGTSQDRIRAWLSTCGKWFSRHKHTVEPVSDPSYSR